MSHPLQCTELSHYYADRKTGETVFAVDNVTLDVPAGQVTVLVGPSGCGKTTLMRALAGLERPTEGQIAFFGQPLRSPAVFEGRVGYVAQADTLIPWRTALRQVTLPLWVAKMYSAAERERLAKEALALVGLAGFEQHYPRQLSGGMRKRVQIARALVRSPDVLVMDEPFASLDALTRFAMQADVLRLVRQRDLTVLLVTHDLDEAIVLGDRIVVFSDRPGKVEYIVENPIQGARDLMEIKGTKEYGDLFERLWSSLRRGPGVTE